MGLQLGIIGGGNMGRAIVRGALEAGVLPPGEVLVAEIDDGRRRSLAELGCRTAAEAPAAVAAAQIMLAVKPQSFPEVARSIGPLPGPKVVISIMAGLATDGIRRALGDAARVVRVMPNTPCQVGAGAAAIALGAGAGPGDEDLARRLFEVLGRTVMVGEGAMHAVTAVSGSGPAYVFLLAEAMEAAARDLGLDAETARLLVEQTVMGAGRLLLESGRGAAALREAVTSPGGTTEAALQVMRKRELPAIVAEAITAARDRGAALEETR